MRNGTEEGKAIPHTTGLMTASEGRQAGRTPLHPPRTPRDYPVREESRVSVRLHAHPHYACV